MAYENLLANPHTGDKTVVAATDDGQNGQAKDMENQPVDIVQSVRQ
jgi:hypothetical protein